MEPSSHLACCKIIRRITEINRSCIQRRVPNFDMMSKILRSGPTQWDTDPLHHRTRTRETTPLLQSHHRQGRENEGKVKSVGQPACAYRRFRPTGYNMTLWWRPCQCLIKRDAFAAAIVVIPAKLSGCIHQESSQC